MNEIKNINEIREHKEELEAKTLLLIGSILNIKPKEYTLIKEALENTDGKTRREFKKGIDFLLELIEKEF